LSKGHRIGYTDESAGGLLDGRPIVELTGLAEQMIQHNGCSQLTDVILLVGIKSGEPQIDSPAPHCGLEIPAQSQRIDVVTAHFEL